MLYVSLRSVLQLPPSIRVSQIAHVPVITHGTYSNLDIFSRCFSTIRDGKVESPPVIEEIAQKGNAPQNEETGSPVVIRKIQLDHGNRRIGAYLLDQIKRRKEYAKNKKKALKRKAEERLSVQDLDPAAKPLLGVTTPDQASVATRPPRDLVSHAQDTPKEDEPLGEKTLLEKLTSSVDAQTQRLKMYTGDTDIDKDMPNLPSDKYWASWGFSPERVTPLSKFLSEPRRGLLWRWSTSISQQRGTLVSLYPERIFRCYISVHIAMGGIRRGTGFGYDVSTASRNSWASLLCRLHQRGELDRILETQTACMGLIGIFTKAASHGLIPSYRLFVSGDIPETARFQAVLAVPELEIHVRGSSPYYRYAQSFVVEAFEKEMQKATRRGNLTSSSDNEPEYLVFAKHTRKFWAFYRELYPNKLVEEWNEETTDVWPVAGPRNIYHLRVDGRDYGARVPMPIRPWAKKITYLTATVEVVREGGPELIVKFKEWLEKERLSRLQENDDKEDRKADEHIEYELMEDYHMTDGPEADGHGKDDSDRHRWSMIDLN